MVEQTWAGAFNARDLGGIPLGAGAVRPGVLFRSGQPEAWSPDGWREASAAGVARVLDLRHPSEPRRPATGAAELGVGYEFAAVDDPNDPRFRARFVPYLNHPNGYADFLDLFAEPVAAAVGRLVEAGPGTVVCCSAGRDRTGLVTGLFLRALGTPIFVLQDADELATRKVNLRHLVRETPHPYECYEAEPEISATVASRRAAIAEFFGQLDAAKFLSEHGVDVAAARPWLAGAGELHKDH
ncbi:tyrosine-protein phosphatase [Gulosibacter macacae]|nr:tyrosine-protein phosphatase [Gulosibacter macacae]